MNDLKIGATFKNAWKKLHGAKASIWSIAIVVILIILTVAYTSNLITTESRTLHYWLSYIIFPSILYLLIGPFVGAGLMVATEHCREKTINIKTGYRYLDRYLLASITMLIIGLSSNLLSIIINIPAVAERLGASLPYFDLLGGLFSLLIYAFFILSVALVVDKPYGVGQAISTSWSAIKPHWLRIFAIFLLAYVILFLLYMPAIFGLLFHNSLVTLLGGIFFIVLLIWFLPFVFLLAGTLYHRLVDEAEPKHRLGD